MLPWLRGRENQLGPEAQNAASFPFLLLLSSTASGASERLRFNARHATSCTPRAASSQRSWVIPHHRVGGSGRSLPALGSRADPGEARLIHTHARGMWHLRRSYGAGVREVSRQATCTTSRGSPACHVLQSARHGRARRSAGQGGSSREEPRESGTASASQVRKPDMQGPGRLASLEPCRMKHLVAVTRRPGIPPASGT